MLLCCLVSGTCWLYSACDCAHVYGMVASHANSLAHGRRVVPSGHLLYAIIRPALSCWYFCSRNGSPNDVVHIIITNHYCSVFSQANVLVQCIYALCGVGASLFPPCPFTSSSFPPFNFSLSFIGFTFFLLLSIPSLSTRIVPLRFQAGGCRRRPNLGLVCFVL